MDLMILLAFASEKNSPYFLEAAERQQETPHEPGGQSHHALRMPLRIGKYNEKATLLSHHLDSWGSPEPLVFILILMFFWGSKQCVQQDWFGIYCCWRFGTSCYDIIYYIY